MKSEALRSCSLHVCVIKNGLCGDRDERMLRGSPGRCSAERSRVAPSRIELSRAPIFIGNRLRRVEGNLYGGNTARLENEKELWTCAGSFSAPPPRSPFSAAISRFAKQRKLLNVCKWFPLDILSLRRFVTARLPSIKTKLQKALNELRQRIMDKKAATQKETE